MKNKNLQMKWMAIIVLMALLLGAVGMTKANPVDVKTANKAAQSFLNAKMGSCPKIDLIDFAEKSSFSNFYVFGNEHCFVIIAADDCVHPVLGYSTENAFGIEEMPENVFGWLKAYNEDVALAVNSKMEATEDIRTEWNNLLNGQGLTPKTRTSVAPLLRTTWRQNAPYNNLCPEDPTVSPLYDGHTPTGCLATAMAQILNYWEYPVRGIGSHSYSHPEYGVQFADYGATVYDWDNMRNNYSNEYTDEEANAVATLMYHCGVSVGMDYTPSGSGGNYDTACMALKTYFNYSPNLHIEKKSYITIYGNEYIIYTDEEWIAMLKDELNLNRPMCYNGGYILENQSGAHAFVCDGYDENDMFHFNWGWGGSSDGYYAIGALNTGSGSTQQWNQWNAYFCDCIPNMPSINPPANVVTTVSGRSVNIQWNSVEDAISYKLYRDGDLVISNITSTNYTENNVNYGIHFYYIKSVASDSTMSLKSDISIADVHFSGPVPNLQASINGHNINLSWDTIVSETATLQYGTGTLAGSSGFAGNSDFYWAQRFPSSVLCEYSGMAINKVSVYFRYEGTYTLLIYKGNEINTTEMVYQQNYTATAGSWQDINIFYPVFIDYTQDLWVALYASSSISYPAAFCSYSGNGVTNASYWSSTGNGWGRWGNYQYSWMMKTYITDGTYTYNLYRNGDTIANNLSGNTYTDNNLPDDHYVYYVTTNYFGGESDHSNEVEVMIGNPQYTISATANPSTGGCVSGGGTFGYGQTCTLMATPKTKYIFLNWTEDGNIVSTNTTYSFLAESNRTLTANFVPRYNLVSVSSSGGGSVSGGGTYQYGQTCTLTAVPNAGYVFEGWTKNGETISTNATFTFAVTENAIYTANFTIAPSGVLNGLFSVGDSKQVRFSQGNLQYQASTDTWRFAENQLSYVGGINSGNVYEGGILCNNELISSEYDGWIDLFGWGTSGYDHGAVCYQPWSTSTENTNYYAYNNAIFNLYDESGLADWGANPVVNGKNTPNYWRTLKTEEWQYLFNSRSGIRYAKAKVNNLKGVVVLPDNWDANVYGFNNPNLDTVPFESNMIALEDWNSLEAAGAVFLPAVGIRNENSVSLVGSYTGYWSSSRYNNNCACCVVMYTNYFGHTFNYRNKGYAVRLVSDYSVITQTTQLSPGWNWYSTYIEQEGIDGLGQLENSIGIPKAIIQSQNSGYVKSVRSHGQTVWQGALGSINNEEMYKIGTKYICSATMEGNVTTPAEHPITINKGWNWIGFPCNQSVSVGVAMSGFTPKNGDVIKGINSYATFSNGTWSGTLNTLEPGQGYMYGSKSSRPKTLVFQTGRGDATIANITPENNFFQPAEDYADNMTLTAIVELDGEELRSDDYELAAFVGDECRGSVKLMYVESIDRYVAFLTVFGDQEEDMRFVLTNGESMNWSDDPLTFAVDGMSGTLTEPATLRFGASAQDYVNIFPNPSNGVFNIEGKSIRRVNIVNAYGQVVLSKEVADDIMQIDLNDKAAGIYMLQVVTDNGITTRQLIKK